ncbi:hypothetical protein ACRALDRAFT_2025557 [Sodiomyces alcalophilus JCM 7366]|uniref:uncharacterized protein n=1 Tax=Sodiomyces alcalophilus JCM 7366 TaxID=591952 RepID=UPI0039B36E53
MTTTQRIPFSIPREEVTIASSLAGAPRLDFSSFSSFALDDADKPTFPRTKSSNDLVYEAMRRADDNHDDSSSSSSSLDGHRTRPRAGDDGDRASMSDLIRFLQTVPPPPQNYLTSAFDDDENEVTEGPGKWKQLRNKFRLRIQRPNSTASDHVPLPRPQLPGTTVVAKTKRGHSHIAISVPMEHCHLGPNSDWSVAAFNATKPLPPSPPMEPRDRVMKAAGHENGGLPLSLGVTRGATEDDRDRLFMGTRKPRMPKLQTKNSNPSIRLWARHAPISPPQSPPATSAGSSHGSRPATSSTTHLPRIPLPMDPNDYVEVSKPTTPAPKTPESIVEERIRQVHVSWLTTTHLLESAGGPPPVASKSPPTKPLPSPSSRFSTNRPQHLQLPLRQSSLKAPVGPLESAPHTPSERTAPNSPLHLPALAYSPPLSAHATHAAETENKTDQTESTAPARNSSTRTNVSTKSRAEKVKSLKLRDMAAAREQLAREQLQKRQQSRDGKGDDLPREAQRPKTAETSISSFRLPSREGNLSVTDLVAPEFSRPPTADQDALESTPDVCAYSATTSRPPSDMISATEEHDHSEEALESASYAHQAGRHSLLLQPGSARPSAPEDTPSARTSTISSMPSLRFNSFTRTSWASSIPLLDRFGSYEPSEASFVQEADLTELQETPHRRSDSATLPRMEQERLVPSRLSYIVSPEEQHDSDEEAVSSGEEEATVHGSSSAPSPEPTPKLSAILPEIDAQSVMTLEDIWPTSGSASGSTSDSTSDSAPSTSSVPESPVSELGSSEPTPPQTPCGGFPPQRYSATADEVPASDVSQPSSTHTRQLSGPGGQPPAQDVFHPRAWTTRSDSDFFHSPVELSRFDHVISHHSPYGLRLSSEPRAADLAQHILLNQKRLELDLRRQEHKQMIFFSQLERKLEDIKRTIPSPGHVREHSAEAMPVERRISHRRGLAGSDPTRPTKVFSSERGIHAQNQSRGPRRLWLVDGMGDDYGKKSSGWQRDWRSTLDERGPVDTTSPTEHVRCGDSTRDPGSPSQQQQQKPSPTSLRQDLLLKDYGLEAMEPLIQELQDSSPVSLESPGRSRTVTVPGCSSVE